MEPLPGKVMGVRVTPGVMNLSLTLTVTWKGLPEEAVTYTVKYATQLGKVNTPPEGALNVTGVSGTSTILTALKRGTTYYIWVVRVSEEGEGPHSDRRSRATFDSELGSINTSLQKEYSYIYALNYTATVLMTKLDPVPVT